MFTDNKRPLAVVTTVSSWDEIPRIRHHVTKQLMRSYNVLYVQLYTPNKSVIMEDGNLIVSRLGGYLRGVTRIQVIHNVFNTWQARRISKMVAALGYDNAVLVNFQYDFPQISAMRIFRRKLFICNDDFVNMLPEDSNNVRERKRKLQEQVVRHSDCVLATSEPLVAMLRCYGVEVGLFLSGHDFSIELGNDCPRKLSDEIKVCYMGYIHNRLAIQWFHNALDDESIRMTLVGPVEDSSIIKGMVGHPRLLHTGPLIGRDLQQFMMTQDVFVMPYSSAVDNEVTTVPAKLFQYLACGRPVVSSLMPNLIQLGQGCVYQANSSEDFLRLIKLAWEEDSEELRLFRKIIASKHTWNHRGDELFRFIEGEDEIKRNSC
jgi:glycosyltransferase involved in cell wall biosynthesis